jgi:hypothetical protein
MAENNKLVPGTRAASMAGFNRKAKARLERRLKDWFNMQEAAKDPIAFATRMHKPGSTKR